MKDLYLIENSTVLKNLLGITDEKALDIAEAELSRANMMLLYENGFSDFSSNGICFIHKELFGDVYEWTGQYRKINIKKREDILAGQSVWYSDCTNIEQGLEKAWKEINNVDWTKLSKEDFAKKIAHLFPAIWQVHPFREGNGRTQRIFILYLAGTAGYTVDFSDVTPEEMIVASAESFACAYDKINAMFERITTPIAKEEQIRHIQYFFGRNSPVLQWLL